MNTGKSLQSFAASQAVQKEVEVGLGDCPEIECLRIVYKAWYFLSSKEKYSKLRGVSPAWMSDTQLKKLDA